jgi:hypothetical protein
MAKKLYWRQKQKVVSDNRAAEILESSPKARFYELKEDGSPNLKRRASPYCVYPEEAHRWMTLKQFKGWAKAGFPVFKNATSHDQKIEEAEWHHKAAEGVVKFLEEWGGNPINDFPANGHFQGLVEFLKSKGKRRSAKLVCTPGTGFGIIQSAWRLYRQNHPFKVRRSSCQEHKIEEQENQGPKEKTVRSSRLYGDNVSAVIRRLTLEGYDYEEISTVLRHHKIDITEKSIKGQMWCATQRGKYGLAAKLSDKVLDEIMDIIIASKPKVQEKPPKKSRKKKL